MKTNIASRNCILIVDDDYINRELLKNIFSSQYTFEEAENGREGLLQIRQHLDKLCAIILDVQMPEMSGLEVLEETGKLGITEQVPTFLITAQDDDAVVNQAYSLGVVDVMLMMTAVQTAYDMIIAVNLRADLHFAAQHGNFCPNCR